MMPGGQLALLLACLHSPACSLCIDHGHRQQPHRFTPNREQRVNTAWRLGRPVAVKR
jgi:hypothetical protein